MKRLLISSILLTALLMACSAPAQVPAPTAPPTPMPARGTVTPTAATRKTLAQLMVGAPEPVAQDLAFAEGPLWLPDGRLIVSEIQGDKVTSFSAGSRTDFQKPSGKSNGHALDLNGQVIQAEHAGRRIVRIAQDGKETMLVDRYEGKRFNSPNDLIVHSDGSIWFTDPDYGLEGRSSELNFNGVYRFDPATGALILLTRNLGRPNGIAFSPDERTLYVSDSDSGRVSAFTVNPDRTLGPARDFGPGADGIGVDADGRVWATTATPQVAVIDADGTLLGTFDLPESTTNLAWGGSDGKQLFITTSKGLYQLAVTVSETKSR